MIRFQTLAVWKTYPTPGIKSSKPDASPQEQDAAGWTGFFNRVRCGS